MDEFDPWSYKCFRVFLPHGTSEQLIAALVLAFFFMNVSNKIGYIHGNGLRATISLKSNVNDVLAHECVNDVLAFIN